MKPYLMQQLIRFYLHELMGACSTWIPTTPVAILLQQDMVNTAECEGDRIQSDGIYPSASTTSLILGQNTAFVVPAVQL
ncbi:MAG: hypothetical protein IPG48_14320 [Saprospiraceae bacterium]|nr:hypothetical protein [Saprospiraceae bacterium]